MWSFFVENDSIRMKKFVRSRWSQELNDPRLPCQWPEWDSDLRFNHFSALERGSVSNQETAGKAADLGPKVAEIGKCNRFKITRPSLVVTGDSRRTRRRNRHFAGLSSTVDVKLDNERPDATYNDLITDVFERKGKTELRKCDIMKSLRNRYPYFRALRRLDSCVGMALRKGSKFTSTQPGVWRYRRPDPATGSGDFSATPSSARKRRARKRPNSHRVEWSRSPPTDAADTQVDESEKTCSGSEQPKVETESSAEANFDNSESDAYGLQICSNTLPRIDEGLDSTAAENTTITVEKLMQQLKQFNEQMLEKTIAKITEENKKFLQNMISSFEEMEMRRHRTETQQKHSKKSSDCKSRSKTVLAKQINEIISQNEKCLELLASSSASHSESVTTMASSLLQKPSKSVAAKTVFRDTSRYSQFIDIPNLTADVSASASASATTLSGLISSAGKTSSAGLRLPLPVLSQYHSRQRNHVRFGKRMVPRLKSFRDQVPMASERNISPKIASKNSLNKDQGQNLEDSSSTSLGRKPTQISKSFYNAYRGGGKVSSEVETTVEHNKESLDDEFAKFAREHGELDDIVATIDPSMAVRCGKKQDLFEKTTESLRIPQKAAPPDTTSSDLSASSVSRTCGKNISIRRSSAYEKCMKEDSKTCSKSMAGVSGNRKMMDDKTISTAFQDGACKPYGADQFTSVLAPQRGFSYRYIPYQWGINCSNSMISRQPVLMDANKYLLYSAAQGLNGSDMDLSSGGAHASQSPRANEMIPTDSRCRIQGPNVFGFHVAEKNLPCYEDIYISKR